ncbi:MAG TPA: SURF1 family protein [Betaproteobacteria bacterium]|jgi:surfeit locus 1 family protein|nr:SURF1 family protein [Betaproteobacteria bacterium]
MLWSVRRKISRPFTRFRTSTHEVFRLKMSFVSQKMRGVRFRPGLVPTVATLIVLALTIHLGNWQRGRASEKLLQQKDFDTRLIMPPMQLPQDRIVGDVKFRTAVARGLFDAAGQFFVDNKSDGATVGYYVVTPLQLEASKVVLLVNRGFVPRGLTYPSPPVVPVPVGAVTVTGLLSVPNERFLELGQNSPVQGSVWQNLTIERYRTHTRRDVASFWLLADPVDAGLRPVIERPDAKVEKHVEYMLTWYSLAVTVVLLWLALNLKFSHRGGSE